MAAEKPDIHAIFDEAVARDSHEERARYLDQACGNNPQVRERVESLLRAHSAAGGFFGGPSPAPPATDIGPVIDEDARQSLGSTDQFANQPQLAGWKFGTTITRRGGSAAGAAQTHCRPSSRSHDGCLFIGGSLPCSLL